MKYVWNTDINSAADRRASYVMYLQMCLIFAQQLKLISCLRSTDIVLLSPLGRKQSVLIICVEEQADWELVKRRFPPRLSRLLRDGKCCCYGNAQASLDRP
jgi:hypothetical protein